MTIKPTREDIGKLINDFDELMLQVKPFIGKEQDIYNKIKSCLEAQLNALPPAPKETAE